MIETDRYDRYDRKVGQTSDSCFSRIISSLSYVYTHVCTHRQHERVLDTRYWMLERCSVYTSIVYFYARQYLCNDRRDQCLRRVVLCGVVGAGKEGTASGFGVPCLDGKEEGVPSVLCPCILYPRVCRIEHVIVVSSHHVLCVKVLYCVVAT